MLWLGHASLAGLTISFFCRKQIEPVFGSGGGSI